MRLKATLLATALTLGFSATHLSATAVEKPKSIVHSDDRLLQFLEAGFKPSVEDVIKYLDEIYKESPYGYGHGNLTETQHKIAKHVARLKDQEIKDKRTGF